jgi:hypothetical protein
MPGLADSEILDLVNSTLQDLAPGDWVQLLQARQRYEVMTKWLPKAEEQSNGIGWKRRLAIHITAAGRHVGIHEVDTIVDAPKLENISGEWSHYDTHYVYDKTEVTMNAGESKLTDLLALGEASALISASDDLESAMFTLKDPGDTRKPLGIPYWIVGNASTGFNGGNPPGYSTVGGLDTSAAAPDNANYKNYTFTYSAYTKDALIKPWRTAHRLTQWESPVTVEDFRGSRGQDLRYYMNNDTIDALETIGEGQTENLGRDLFPYDGQVTFKRHPLVYVPILNDDATNPIYGIDHTVFKMLYLKDWKMRRSDAKEVWNRHNDLVVWYDLKYATVCLDRRRCIKTYKV